VANVVFESKQLVAKDRSARAANRIAIAVASDDPWYAYVDLGQAMVELETALTAVVDLHSDLYREIC
jgi:hypothetical protein